MYFDKPYNRTIFLNLLQSKMFPNFVRKEEHLGFGNKTAYFVENGIYKLGTVNLDKEITILEIEQKSSNDPRITLTKDAFKILEYHGIDHAIIIFHCKDTTSYRLSLLTVSYENWEKKTSSYKRYSYILGPNEKVKTPEKELLHTIKDYEDLTNRFKVEVVRDQFFDEYLELFVRLYKAIQDDEPFVQLLESQNVDIVSFTKNLLGKIIFLYFIQKKGWLGLGRNTTTKYGEGNRNFMRVMRDNFKKNNESMSTEKTGYFYNDYLEWLFFAGLNTDRRDNDDWFPNLQMKVPYLNGGLFKEEYTGWESYVTKIDNNIFSNVDEKGEDGADGILDIFDRYNFTIDEDSLYDRDIAVDPEMLGRIFEKMISISNKNIKEVVELYDEMKAKGKGKFDFGNKLNKDLGAFYTPREIVHYMTQECLSGYLQTKTKATEEEISKLFEIKEAFMLDRKELNESGFSSEFLQNIDEALKQVKVLDPAVGSGAYPMGLLHEISGLRYYLYGAFHSDFGNTIDEFKNKEGKISLYKIKKDIILNNIYGVDIDPGAIDIAKLRFWLSLVVDAQTPEPLPNFEFKFVCANSLVSLADETKEKDLFATGDEPKLETLKKYKRDFYNASSKQEKKELKKRIIEYTKIENTLFSQPTLRAKQIEEFGKNFDNPKHQHSFFDSSLMFSEWRGFDIVIGNPPYKLCQPSNTDEEMLEYYKTRFKVVSYKIDLFHLFFEKGINLLKSNGIISYITPNTYLTNKYIKPLRKYILEKCSIHQVINHDKVFDSASVDNATIIMSKGYVEGNIINIILHKNHLFYENGKKNQDDRLKDSDMLFNINEESAINLGDCMKLGGIGKTYFGIQAYDRKSSISDKKIGDSYLPFIDGADIHPWAYAKPKIYFNYIEENIKSGGDWNVYSKERIVVRQIGQTPVSGLCEKDILGSNTLYSVYMNDDSYLLKYILACLNSKVIKYYWISQYSDNKALFPKIKGYQLRELPIPKATKDQQVEIVGLVDQLISCFYDDTQKAKKIEEEMNEKIYKLYGLTDEEIQIVEESMK